MPCTRSTAGRHAADRERERQAQALIAEDAERSELQQAARERLASALQFHGLEAHRRFEEVLGPDRTLKVDCRLESCANDQRLVYAILDSQGWMPDRRRLTRISARYHVLRVAHRVTGAALSVVLSLPNSEVEQWEAA